MLGEDLLGRGELGDGCTGGGSAPARERDGQEVVDVPLVPSEMACFESSPGRMRRTEVWISREEMVDFLLYEASFEASPAILSLLIGIVSVSFSCPAKETRNKTYKISLTNELRMSMALFEIPVSGWTCFKTL